MSAKAPLLAATLGIALLAAPARAQVDHNTRLSARTLAEAGLAKEKAHDYAGALADFENALRLVQMPTVAVLAGNCLVKLGRLVEAVERYRSARGMTIDPSLPDDFRAKQAQAQADAEAARLALEKQIPKVVVALEGAAPEDVELRIDDKVVPSAVLGLDRPVDPGAHRIELRRGAEVLTRAVTLAEGARERVVFTLAPRPRAVAPVAGPTAPLPAAPSADRPGGAQRTAGVVVAALGGAGLVAGGITWGLAYAKRSALDKECADLTCPSTSPTLDAYNALRTTTIASLVVGGAAVGAGVVTIVTAPSGGPLRVSLSPWVGPGVAGLRGSF